MDLTDLADLAKRDPHLRRQSADLLARQLAVACSAPPEELLSGYRSLLFALLGEVDRRELDNGTHPVRVQHCSAMLAQHLSQHPKYRDQIHPGFVAGIFEVSPLHDIGKIFVPEATRQKKSRLTEEEYAIVKRHTEFGSAMLRQATGTNDSKAFRMAGRICRHHHERWDGNGYPDGLRGEEIPLEARILSIVDAFDEILIPRPHCRQVSYEFVRAEFPKHAGTHFDPDIVAVMLEHMEECEETHRLFLQ